MYTPLLFCVPLIILFLYAPATSILVLIALLVLIFRWKWKNKHLNKKGFCHESIVELEEMQGTITEQIECLNQNKLFNEEKTHEIIYFLQRAQREIISVKESMKDMEVKNDIRPYDPDDWTQDRPFGIPGDPPRGIL